METTLVMALVHVLELARRPRERLVMDLVITRPATIMVDLVISMGAANIIKVPLVMILVTAMGPAP